jgi:hypothetical protein
MKHIQRQTDTLIRIKEDLKYRILLKNATGKQSRDYFSFAKEFRNIDLNSDGHLDRDEFYYACGPKRLNLGLPKKDVVKLFNEFAKKTTNGGDSTSDIISMKGFLNGMADLDKPDLDLVSVLSEYKGRALSVLIDRLNDAQPTPGTGSGAPGAPIPPPSTEIPHELQNLLYTNREVAAAASRVPSPSTSDGGGASLPTPQRSPIRMSSIRRRGSFQRTLKSKSTSALLSSKSKRQMQSQRSFIKLPLLRSPVRISMRAKHRLYTTNPDIDNNAAPPTSPSLPSSPTTPTSPASPTPISTRKLIESVSTSSHEAEVLSIMARSSHRGWFSGKRTQNSPLLHTPSINILQNQQTNMWHNNKIFGVLPPLSPVRSSHQPLPHYHDNDATGKLSTTTISSKPPSSSSMPSSPPPLTNPTKGWHNSYAQERRIHKERTRSLSYSKKRVGYEHTAAFKEQEQHRDDLYWLREKNRVLGKAKTKTNYQKRVFAQQEIERNLSDSPATKGGMTCNYAMRTKVGNGGFW